MSDSYIQQVKISKTLQYFGNIFKNKFNLSNYTSPNKPSFFLGCYSLIDLRAITQHKSFAVIIWGGSDTYYQKYKRALIILNKVKKYKNIHHIALSKYIRYDLRHFKIKNTHPMYNLHFKKLSDYNALVKGPNIYVYTSATISYNNKLLVLLLKQLQNKYNFIICTNSIQYEKVKRKKFLPNIILKQLITSDNIKNIYNKCFIGLRLTLHDGNANTVQELGLYGIKCIFNGNNNIPNSLNWKNINNIIKFIDIEYKTIGERDIELSDKVKKYLELKHNICEIKYYK